LPTRTSRESSDAVVWQSLSDMSTHKLGWNLEEWRRGCLRKHLERILPYSWWARSMNAQPPRNCARTMSRLATSGADWNRKKIWTRSVLEMQFLVLGEAASTAYGGAGGILPATGWHEGERGGSAYKKRTGMPCARSTEPVLGGPQTCFESPPDQQRVPGGRSGRGSSAWYLNLSLYWACWLLQAYSYVSSVFRLVGQLRGSKSFE
jgi:hypothetical protein